MIRPARHSRLATRTHRPSIYQPLYQGGKIKYSIRKAGLEQDIARLQTATDRADIKLELLEQYLNLFSLYKQDRVLNRNIEESERRLKDIRRMKEEALSQTMTFSGAKCN